ncbi:MAG: carbohydrate ABC transporter permease, partial [Oscillospiraceae bacterium]|nr:carbohydrate ABC transporter permease [Oscillospiraceae bacterium]
MNKKEYKKTYEANKANANYTHLIRFESAIIFILCILLTLICLLPFVIVVVNATRDHGEISRSVSLIPSTHLIENIKNLSTPEMKRTFDAFVGYKNSAIITISATVLSVFFSALTAYGLCVYDFKLRDAATTFILAVLMIPTQVSGVGFIKFMLAIDLYNNFLPLIIPAIAAPAVVFFMRQ